MVGSDRSILKCCRNLQDSGGRESSSFGVSDLSSGEALGVESIDWLSKGSEAQFNFRKAHIRKSRKNV